MERVLLLFFLTACTISAQGTVEGPYVVHRVVDGDTVDIELGRVRLSGINAPENGVCYAAEAKEKLTELVLYKEVFIEWEEQRYDKYGRILAYVYFNGTHINAYLVEQGYASVFDKYNQSTKYYEELKQVELKAVAEGKGVWACEPIFDGCLYVASKNSDIYHSPECKWAKRIKPENLICFHSEDELEGFRPAESC